ncbi:MAG: hypothetical protein ACFFBS_10375 [Promethearchaeota archaeon]
MTEKEGVYCTLEGLELPLLRRWRTSVAEPFGAPGMHACSGTKHTEEDIPRKLGLWFRLAMEDTQLLATPAHMALKALTSG